MNFDLESNPKDYIGDGVYAEFDGYSVTLRTDRQYEQHWICLEPNVLMALNQFWERCHPEDHK